MCKIEKQLETENKLPTFYKRYVDDTLSVMPDLTAASEFLTTLNESHPSINITMELEENGKLPFLGMNVINVINVIKSKNKCEKKKKTLFSFSFEFNLNP